MKVRIHNDSLRIRLTQTEVAQLAEGERVDQTTFFTPTAKLTCAIESTTDPIGVRVVFDGSHLTLQLPASRVTRWANSDEVGIETEQKIDPSRSLYILVEKDFKCLHGEAEENEDAFPNPLAK